MKWQWLYSMLGGLVGGGGGVLLLWRWLGDLLAAKAIEKERARYGKEIEDLKAKYQQELERYPRATRPLDFRNPRTV